MVLQESVCVPQNTNMNLDVWHNISFLKPTEFHKKRLKQNQDGVGKWAIKGCMDVLNVWCGGVEGAKPKDSDAGCKEAVGRKRLKYVQVTLRIVGVDFIGQQAQSNYQK